MIISASLRRQVIERAGNCCEYCGLAQTGQEAAFHIDHVLPIVAGGNTTLENLALACVSCSLRKGPRLLVRDHKRASTSRCFIRASTRGERISAGRACELWVSHRQDAQRLWRSA